MHKYTEKESRYTGLQLGHSMWEQMIPMWEQSV